VPRLVSGYAPVVVQRHPDRRCSSVPGSERRFKSRAVKIRWHQRRSKVAGGPNRLDGGNQLGCSCTVAPGLGALTGGACGAALNPWTLRRTASDRGGLWFSTSTIGRNGQFLLAHSLATTDGRCQIASTPLPRAMTRSDRVREQKKKRGGGGWQFLG
jgi:hypothetical protein